MTPLVFTGWLFLLGACSSFFAGLLGLGGGIVIIPGLNALFVYNHFDRSILMQLSLGTSLATVFFTALISLRAHQKFTAVNWTVIKMMVPGLVVGAIIGPLLSAHLPSHILAIIFAGMLAYFGCKFLLNQHIHRGHAPLNPWFIAPSSLIMGVTASMLGLGGGILMVPFLSRFDLEMREIIAVSAVCLIPSSFIGTLGYIYAGWGHVDLPAYSTGYIYWLAVLPLVLVGLIFAPIGVRLVHTLPHNIVRRIFGLFLILISLHMIWTLL